MRFARLLAAAIVAIGLAPGTFVRSPPHEHDFTSPVIVTALDLVPQPVGAMRLEAGWELASENDLFGGWSAMVDWLDDTLLVGSDAGRIMVLKRPDTALEAPRLAVLPRGESLDKRDRDLESLSRDPETDELWAGFERSNSIVRIARPLRPIGNFRPPEMAGWPVNAGPESLVRFPDGRLLVVAETAVAPGRHEAVLFPEGLPVRSQAVRFQLAVDEEYRPSDAAALPDGRMLVLLRRVEWALPPRFPVMLAIADPSDLAEGAVLPVRELARIEAPLPSDNYEGVAVTAEPEGKLGVWLISDDNFARYQRTILLKLSWDGKMPTERQKARR